jgi:hypothetical protein
MQRPKPQQLKRYRLVYNFLKTLPAFLVHQSCPASPTVEGMEARSQQPMMMPACVGLAPMCSRKDRTLGTIRL